MPRWIVFITSVFLVSVPFFLPPFFLHDSNSTLLTAVSLLFAILVGFFIATTTSNYLRLQTLIADSNAGLISLHNLVRVIEPGKREEIGDAVDNYMITALDYEFLDYADKTKKEQGEIVRIVNELEPASDKGMALLSEVHSRMDEILTNEQEIALTGKEIVTPRHWFIIILLTLLLSASLLSFRDGTTLVSIFVSVMLLALFHILVLIYEIDTNMFLSKQLSFKDPQQVFQGIGRLPYYPQYALIKGYAKPETEVYRIGVYNNYPKSLDKIIQIVGSQ